jgi:serpin B
MKSYRSLLFAFLAISCGACSSTPVDPPDAQEVTIARSSLPRDRAPVVADAVLAQAVADNNRFAADLYQQLAKRDASKNLFFSAYSVSSAFAMVRNGARGDTATQLGKALRFTLPSEQLDPAMNKIALELESRAGSGSGSDGKGFRLAVNNAFWGEGTATWQPAYLDALAVSYDAGIHLVDFVSSAEKARQTINGWVAQKTENRIQDLMPAGSIDASTRLVLTNTVYFNAAWREPFLVKEMTFPGSSGARVPAIGRQGAMKYASTEGAEVVAIPYEGNKLEMVVVVPTDLATFEPTLAGDALQALLDRPEPELLELTLPKFRVDGETIDLSGELEALGLTGGSDFSGISPEPLSLAGAYHKAFVKVNEKGTEAAAATGTVFAPASADPRKPKVVNVDHPFLFFVRDVPTKQVLFSGRVVTPTYKD